jgi:hypothetical protein
VQSAAGQAPQQKAVDRAEGDLACRRALAQPGNLVKQPADLRGREIRVDDQAGAFGNGSASPAARQASQISAVRRSCQTIALCTGRPVERSHNTAVSRWLVMPDRGDRGVTRRSDCGTAGHRHGTPDLLRVVLDPARAR